MTQTNNLKIDLVAQSQAQKEVTINEAIYVLEALQNKGVKDKDLATPPVSPAAGDSYIVAASPTGDWAGKAKFIAYYNQIWRFIEPNEGLLVWVNDEDKIYAYDGSAWVSYADNLNNVSKLGINSAADSTNKLSVASDAVLFNHNGTNSQIKVNKNASGNTASFIFQDGFSGRAEFGLVGDDDFQLKVSADGSSFNQAFVVDKTTGDASFKKKVGVGNGSLIASIYTASATLDFPSIAANSSATLNITVTGAVVGGSVSLGLPSSPPAGIVYQGYVSAADTVTIRAFNVTGSAIDPASASFRATVVNF